jgi:hypothetical protein
MRDTVGFEMLAVMRVVVAGLAKMCGAKAKPDGRRAAPAALEFEEIGAWTREKESFCTTIFSYHRDFPNIRRGWGRMTPSPFIGRHRAWRTPPRSRRPSTPGRQAQRGQSCAPADAGL